MALREWLILLGLLVVVLIVIDGIKRYRGAQKFPKLGLGKSEMEEDVEEYEEDDFDADHNPELPNGGARVVKPAEWQTSSHHIAPPPPKALRSREEIFQSSAAPAVRREPRVSSLGTQGKHHYPPSSQQATLSAQTPATSAAEPAAPALASQAENRASSNRDQDMDKDAWHADDEYAPTEIEVPVFDPARAALEKALHHQVPGKKARATLGNADEVIVINVMAPEEDGYLGSDLVNLLVACGMRYSPGVGIFNRFEANTPDSELLFSVVNRLKPGSFPIEEGAEFFTPGVTFLLPLPLDADPSRAFEAMVETATVITKQLGGGLKDEHHSTMTAQTISFARERVKEFERRQRLNHYRDAG